MAASPARGRRLVEWFQANGGSKSPGVELAEDGRGAFHFRARVNHEGTPASKFDICSCPTELSLSWLNIIPVEEKVLDGVSVRAYDSVFTQLWNVVPSHILSRFVLLEQALLKERSFWAPYIDTLPHDFDTIMYYSDQDRQWLNGTNLDTFRDIRHTLWRSEWELVIRLMQASSEPGMDSQYQWESYVWAASIFTSRGFDSTLAFPNSGLDQFAVLYPVVDSLNHDSNAKVDWAMGLQAFTLSTFETLKVGQEVYNNYGSKGNEELLAGYGFCIPDNPFDQVVVRIGGLLPTIKEVVLNNHHVDPQDMIDDDFSQDLYLRAPDCKLGQYDNKHSRLSGIPPFLFKIALGIYLYTTSRPNNLRYDLPESRPGRHIVGAVRQLLQVLQVRHQKLVGSAPGGEPANSKQRYACMYRAGQLNVVDCNIAALHEILPALADQPSSMLSSDSILSTREAIAQLEDEDPTSAKAFLEGVRTVLVDPEDAGEVQDADCEDVVWVLWLTYTYVLTEHTPHSRIHAWLANLMAFYAIRDQQSNPPPAFDFALEKIIEVAQQGDAGGAWVECSKRKEVVFWAAQVVQFEAWQVLAHFIDSGPGEERETRWVMYMDAGERQDETGKA